MSNKKNLLNEVQVRQFMKLASLQPLTPGFVNGLTEKAAFDKGQETEVGGKADESPTKGQEKKGGGKAYEKDLEEGHGRGGNEYHEAGVHRGGGIKLDEEGLQYRDDVEADLGATEDELGAEDELAAALAAIACDPPTSTAGAGGDAPAVPTSAGVTPPTASTAGGVMPVVAPTGTSTVGGAYPQVAAGNAAVKASVPDAGPPR